MPNPILRSNTMVKRFFLIFICFILVFSFVSCGNKTNDEESVIVKETENSKDYTLDESHIAKKITFTEDGIKITIEDILYDEIVTWLKFTVENNTEKAIKILTTDLSINDIMCNYSLLTYVEPKSTKTDFLEISNEWFYDLDIRTIKDIELTVRILDENSEEIKKSDPLKVLTDASKKYVQQYKKEGSVIYEKDNVLIISQGIKKSKLSDDTELGLFIENNTDKHFSVMLDEVLANDKVIAPTFIVSVGAKKVAVDSILFSKEALSIANIEKITNLKLSFKAINQSSEMVFKTETIEISFE